MKASDYGVLRSPDGSEKRIRMLDLQALVDAGLIEMTITEGGQPAYEVTDAGRHYYRRLKAEGR